MRKDHLPEADMLIVMKFSPYKLGRKRVGIGCKSLKLLTSIFANFQDSLSTRAFIVNIGDLMERWTNCLFRSTLHRVMPTGQERYSMAFFLEPNPNCVVECLKSCCSDSSPPRVPPIRAGDYLEERLKVTYAS